MAETLRNKFFKGIAWTFVQNVAVKVLSIVFTIVLARLLTPEDYGLIGMLSIFIAISDVFIQSGFGQALIQKSNCTEDDYSTAFYFNVVVSIAIYLTLFFTAPLIANFYHEPQLVQLTRVLSLNFVLGAFNIVQQAKLTKAMNFKPLAIITLICTLVSGIVGIIMAYLGFGFWALVSQTLVATLLRVFTFPLFTRWHPSFLFNKDSFRHLWGFGSKILVTGIFEVIMRNLSNILIGRYYDKEQVGYFSKGRNFADIPSTMMSSVLSTVLFPLLSEIHEDEARHLEAFKRVTYYTIFITFPVMIMLALLAKPIVIILFTEKWAPCIPILQAFLLARAFLPLNVINAQMLQSKGETKLYMNTYFIAGPLTIVAIIISIPLGVLAMAWATLISGILYYIIFAIVVGRRIGYGFDKSLWDWRMLFLSILIMSGGIILSTNWLSNLWAQLIIGGIIGFVVYATCCAWFKLVDKQMINIIKSKLKIRSKD